jgi:hypothetical protein
MSLGGTGYPFTTAILTSRGILSSRIQPAIVSMVPSTLVSLQNSAIESACVFGEV